jgi:hypothetical protein
MLDSPRRVFGAGSSLTGSQAPCLNCRMVHDEHYEAQQAEADRAEREEWVRTHCYHCGAKLPDRTVEAMDRVLADPPANTPEDDDWLADPASAPCRCFEG